MTTTVDATVGTTLRRWPVTGGLLIGAAVLAAVGSAVLGAVFDWPAVLDRPGTAALPAFAASEGGVRFGFALQLLSSLILVPAAFGVQQALSRNTAAARALTALGVAGALFQLLGWVRWIVAVPGISQRFASGDSVERTATAAAYDALNGYAGAAVGEHLGWLLQAPWAVAVALLVLRALRLPRWFGLVGLLSAAAWAVLIVPQPYIPALDGDAASSIAFAVYSVWFIWLGALGVVLAMRRVGPGPRSF